MNCSDRGIAAVTLLGMLGGVAASSLGFIDLRQAWLSVKWWAWAC